MLTLPIIQVDAFSEQPLAGNPCAVVFDADRLSSEQMQAIALEMNLSETAFVVKSEAADFGARYFTPAEEIPLAGHPTIATSIALLDADRLQLASPVTRFSLQLKAGIVNVDIKRNRNGQHLVMMTQLRPRFLSTFDPARIAPLFGLDSDDLLPNFPVQTVSTGTPMLMIPLASQDALRRATLRPDDYRALREASDFFSPHLFVLGGATEAGDTFARHFGVPPDTPEDPFTGSATGCMAAYLWRYGLIGGPKFIAEQGHWMNRPGRAFVEVIGTPEHIKSVRVGGCGVVVMRGKITI